jgi:hypothetical protein
LIRWRYLVTLVGVSSSFQEYAGAKNRERLLSLLVPVQRAAEQCGWLKTMVDAGEIFHPLRWTPQQAVQLLRDAAALESAGVVVRMPASWRMNRPARALVTATVGGKAPSQLGMDALLDFQMAVTLDGDTLSKAEIKRLLAQSDGLAFIRGKWVEVDHERLSRTLERFEAIERDAAAKGLSFGEAMRLLAGAGIGGNEDARQSDIDWGQTVAGPWLAQTLAELRRPGALSRVDPGRSLHGALRPYQHSGVEWLHLLELWVPHARAMAGGDTMALGGARRGAGHQEPRAQSKPRRSSSCGPRRALRSPARRSRTGSATSGRFSISSIRGCWARPNSSRASSSSSPIGRKTPTARCASWCARTSCGD